MAPSVFRGHILMSVIFTGGLLSAHLFAVGELPINGYDPPEKEAAFANAWDKSIVPESDHGIVWNNDFVYDGQLLRLAADMANRLLPAFYTETGLPYPRVNLRHGIPFYENAPYNSRQRTKGERKSKQPYLASSAEVTETCSAGAGSLVLEFTVLSRLTGNGRYEELAKRAFWAVWAQRSEIGLIGFGIDVETGKWVGQYAGVSEEYVKEPWTGRLTVDRLVPESIASMSTLSSLTFCSPRANALLLTPTAPGPNWMNITLH